MATDDPSDGGSDDRKRAKPDETADGSARPSRPATPHGEPQSPRPKPPARSASRAKPLRPSRPARPDRPEAPPSTAWSEEEAALVQSHYEPQSHDEPLSEVVADDDDAVIVPAPEPELFAPTPPSPRAGSRSGGSGIRSLAWRRTAIPILLTCGVLLIGIGLLRWLGGADSVFADMSIPLSAALCGCGAVLLLVAMLNMLSVRAELAAGSGREPR